MLKAVSAVLAAVLGPLSCGDTCEYGCPSADFRVRGTVTSSADGRPVPGIAIALGDTSTHDGGSFYTRDIADSNGRYELHYHDNPRDTTALLLCATDTGGVFEGRDTVVLFLRSELTGGDGNWDVGTIEKTVDFRLDSAAQG